MTRANERSTWSACWLLLAAALGCSGGRPGRVEAPTVDAEAAAELAMAEFDRNADRSLDEEELKACPALADAKPAYDADNNGSLSQEEIAAGIGSWAARGVGAIPLPFIVKLDGRPLAGAEIKLIPAPFLGDAIKGAAGLADESGSGSFNMAAEDRPANAPKNLPVMQPGLYRVEITHPMISIPAKYNTSTTLGLEAAVAGQSPVGAMWTLSSK